MSSTLDVDRIVSEVIKKLYLRFGIKALLVIDQPPQLEIINQLSQRFNLPWLSIDVCYLKDFSESQKTMVENSGLLINSIMKAPLDLTTCIAQNNFLILDQLSVSESQKYAELAFESLKDRLVFEFLRIGKEVYYYSEDLTNQPESKPKFMELLKNRVDLLSKMGMKMINANYAIIDGVCDLQTIKKYEGQTILITRDAVISPLAKDFIQTGAVNVIRK